MEPTSGLLSFIQQLLNISSPKTNPTAIILTYIIQDFYVIDRNSINFNLLLTYYFQTLLH